jgi:hypothetical protein
VISNAGSELKLRYKDRSFSAKTMKGEVQEFDGNLILR